MKLETVIRKWLVLQSQYAHERVPDEHTPSAPDTSKFTAVSKGNLEIRERGSFGGEEYAFVFIVGTAFPKRNEVWGKALRIADASGLRYRTVHGTAWSGIGIDNLKRYGMTCGGIR